VLVLLVCAFQPPALLKTVQPVFFLKRSLFFLTLSVLLVTLDGSRSLADQ
jgi:hypothetical protein